MILHNFILSFFFFQRLREAILETQKNVKFQPVEDTPDGNSNTVLFFINLLLLLLFARN